MGEKWGPVLMGPSPALPIPPELSLPCALVERGGRSEDCGCVSVNTHPHTRARGMPCGLTFQITGPFLTPDPSRSFGKVRLLFPWTRTLGSRKRCFCTVDPLGIRAVCAVWKVLIALDLQAWRMTSVTSLIHHLLYTEQWVKHCGGHIGVRPGSALQWISLERTQVKQ